MDPKVAGSPPSGIGRRRYHSPARRRQAEDTRQRILDAARDRFRSSGYAGTTLDAIATAAGFSVKTVVAVFASKRGILAALVDPLLSPNVTGQLVDELRSAQDPRQRIELVARLTRRVYETMAPEFDLLNGASAIAPELAGVARQVGARRRENQQRLVLFLAERKRLRADLGPDEALDVLWTLTSYDVFRMLVRDCSWQPDRYEAWLAELLTERLLEPEGRAAEGDRRML
jgi:AcrR family transcriptional regulator